MASIDISIRGAGIFGLSIAWACLAKGARVEIVDPNGAGAGASGGIVGALAPHVPENWNPKKQFQLESLLMAESFWADVEAVAGQSAGYVRSGRIQPVNGTDAIELAHTRANGAKSLWKGAAKWIVQQDAEIWGLQGDAFIYDTLSAHIQPRMAISALERALENLGVTITDTPRQKSGIVIWAHGADGLEEMTVTFGQEVGRGIKGQAALFQLDRRGAPQVFVDALHMIPHEDGTLAVGSTTERDFDSPVTTDRFLDDVIDRARAALPELADAPILERWAGLRPRARSRAPMLGRWPGRHGHFVANGGFKIGFGMAPKVAQVMADLVIDDKDTIPDGFRVEDNLR